ncbi:MAG: Hpt domain-containing protein [Spirochaetaceae bacterium]
MDDVFLDIEGLISRTMNDLEITKEVLSCYLEETPGQLEELKKAVELENIGQIHEISHGIKGSSASVGAIKMQKLSEKIQYESQKNNHQLIKELTLDLEDIYTITKQVIENTEL